MILTHVQELTPYLEKKLDELVEKHECAAARRGMGFMQGIVIAGRPVGEIVKKALEKKLLVISAGSDVLRIVPPLVITKADIDEMAEILDECLAVNRAGVLVKKQVKIKKDSLKKHCRLILSYK